MKVLIVILGVMGVSSAAVFQVASPSTHPDFPGKCYLEAEKVAVSPGEVYNVPNRCVEITCFSDFTYMGFSCGIGVYDPPLRLVQDHTKPYPGCCPKPVFDE